MRSSAGWHFVPHGDAADYKVVYVSAAVKRFAALGVVIAIAGLAVAGPSPASSAGKGVIILVRHAERVQSAMNDDAPLTDAGRARAERLATLLAKADVKAIFVTRFRRTQETAKPVAAALGLTPIEESDTDQLIAKLRAHGTETVLVVGHSDTVPDVIKAFGGPPVTIADDAFDDVFVLAPATGAFTRLKY
jgi:phosphohistidine phosphatase SixA